MRRSACRSASYSGLVVAIRAAKAPFLQRRTERLPRFATGFVVALLTCFNSQYVLAQDSKRTELGDAFAPVASRVVSVPVDTLENPEDTDRLVAVLIEQLGHPVYRVRVNAQWRLQQLGLAAFEQLRTAMSQHENIEIANAARYIINSESATWYLETDSLEVRDYLQSYEALDNKQRVLRIEVLANHGTPDAIAALTRLARYEQHEDISQEAALKLMEFYSGGKSLTPEMESKISKTVGSGARPALQWLRQMVADLAKPTGVDIDAWKALADDVVAATDKDDQGQSRRRAIKFFTRVCVLLRERSGDDAAIDVVRPSLQLVQADKHGLAQIGELMMDVWQTPVLVEELATTYADIFDADGDLGYLLAESLRRRGSNAEAERIAEKASQRIGMPPEAVKQIVVRNNVNNADLVANMRRIQAAKLGGRGLFEWAEREYIRALEANSKRYEANIREDFSMFYWFGDENAKAAEVLKPLVDEIVSKAGKDGNGPDGKQPSSLGIDVNAMRTQTEYYFYSGLANIQSNELESARDNLRIAYELSSASPMLTNPDIVIAMSKAVDGAEFEKFYSDCFETMANYFRQQVVTEEQRLASAPTSEERRSNGYALASSCNQLAWLLSKCNDSPEEALRLSIRCNELIPDDPTFLDTLGRCYFADGQLEKAVEIQKKALKQSPFERQMVQQLEEFESALRRSGQTSGNAE